MHGCQVVNKQLLEELRTMEQLQVSLQSGFSDDLVITWYAYCHGILFIYELY